MQNNETSWGEIADEYDRKLILPNLLRLIKVQKGEKVLDLACGAGFYTNEIFKQGANVLGIDIDPKLIKIAHKTSAGKLAHGIKFEVALAEKLDFLPNNDFDKIIIVLAIQNIDNVKKVFENCRRILKPQGKVFIVMNHPIFRVLKSSSWGWDEQNKIQYRRVDEYLSEAKIKIQMHPGDNPEEYTLSFHRPLQFYFKLLKNTGFTVSNLEEWHSHKNSEPGPRAIAENKSRKEIPLFLFLEAVKL